MTLCLNLCVYCDFLLFLYRTAMLFVWEMRVPTGATSSRQKQCCESLNENICHPTLVLYGLPLHHGRSVLTTLPQSGPQISVYQTVGGRISQAAPPVGGFAVSNLHGMTNNNQPTKTVLKYVISFCAQICTLTILVIIIGSLGILVLNAAWKFIMRNVVHAFNPIFDFMSRIVKFIKMISI